MSSSYVQDKNNILIDYPSVDLVGDVFEILQMLPDGCTQEVHAYHFIEHVSDLDRLVSELARIMRLILIYVIRASLSNSDIIRYSSYMYATVTGLLGLYVDYIFDPLLT